MRLHLHIRFLTSPSFTKIGNEMACPPKNMPPETPMILINMIGCAPLCAPLCAPMGHMGHMLYCAPLFINGDIDTEVVDTDA